MTVRVRASILSRGSKDIRYLGSHCVINDQGICGTLMLLTKSGYIDRLGGTGLPFDPSCVCAQFFGVHSNLNLRREINKGIGVRTVAGSVSAKKKYTKGP